MTINSRAWRVAMAAVAAAVISCGDDPTTIEDPSLIGVYVLSTVDGGPIPDSVTFSMTDYDFLAETLTVVNSGAFGVYTSVLANDQAGSFGIAGRVDVRGDSLVLIESATRINAAAGRKLLDGLELRMGQPSFFWDDKVLKYLKLDDP